MLGPSTGHRPRLQPSAGLLSRQRGLECLLTRQVSLSFSYSGGLNEGFGWPGLGENHRLPTEPPFFRGSSPCFLPGKEAQGRVCPATSHLPGCEPVAALPIVSWTKAAAAASHGGLGVLSSELGPGAPPWAHRGPQDPPDLPECHARSMRALNPGWGGSEAWGGTAPPRTCPPPPSECR